MTTADDLTLEDVLDLCDEFNVSEVSYVRRGQIAEHLMAGRAWETARMPRAEFFQGERYLRCGYVRATQLRDAYTYVAGKWPKIRELDLSDVNHGKQLLTLDAFPANERACRALIEGEDRGGGVADMPVPEGTFATIVIDPPWPYGGRYDPAGHRAASPYEEMSLEKLAEWKVPNELAAPDCVLWLWTTNAFMRPAYDLLGQWDFEPKTILTWVKDRIGLGYWLRGMTEHCILAVRGSPKLSITNESTALIAPLREHSRKPAEFYEMLKRISPEPRTDLFGREERDGFTIWGNQPTRFQEPA